MSILRLPESLIPLTMHIDPLLDVAKQYELGLPVEMDWSEDNITQIEYEKETLRISFDGEKDCGFRVKDQWIAPYPNIDEAKAMVEKDQKLLLCGIPVETGVIDVWFFNGRPRVEYSPFSGGNQSYRAMLLTSLAVGYDIPDAITLARAYACSMTRGLHECNSGWPVANSDFPLPLCLSHQASEQLGTQCDCVINKPFPTLQEKLFGLYPIVDCAPMAIKLIESGVKMIQLRLKHVGLDDAENQIIKVLDVASKHNAYIFISGQWQLAVKYHAYGVHLTQQELPTADLELIHKEGLRLGLSTHGYYEVIRAMALRPSYIAIGHIFPDATEKTAPDALGLTRLALYQQLVEGYPTVAVGGITLENAYRVWRTGIDGFCVTRAIENTDDLDATIAAFKEITERIKV